MFKKMGLMSLVLGLVISGCAPVISQHLRDQVTPDLTFRDVAKDPDFYKGKMVIWSGAIIKSENLKEGTLIEVLEKPADSRGRPLIIDKSGGRFLALYPGYLDTAIYSQNRLVAVAGRVKEKRVLPLGEIEYSYPLISVEEIYLWKLERDYRDEHPFWWYYPHWWRYPYWHPFY